MGRNFYAVLGVPRDADANTIKQAYRSLARRWHPDKNPGNQAEAQAKFQQISEAYEILSDPSKRAAFDRFGEEGLRPSRGGSQSGRGCYTYARADDIFRRFFGEAMFSSFFGMTGDDFGTFGAPPRGPALVREVSVSCSLEQLFRGTSKDVRIRRMRGGWKEDAILRINIAPGASALTKYRFPGEGDILRGREPEEIVFILDQLAHPKFVRDGDDLATTMRISLKESLCGVARSVVGIDGEDVAVVDRRVLKPGTDVVVDGQGMPRKAGGRGALHVTIDVVWPDELDDDTRTALETSLPDVNV